MNNSEKTSVRCPNCEKLHVVPKANLKKICGDWCNNCCESFKDWSKEFLILMSRAE